MNALTHQFSGLERVRDRFVDLLEDRKNIIAKHALAAWDGETTDEINDNLKHAQNILHQIAGSAGTVGFPELGGTALLCEEQIIAHLDGPYADLAICPGEIMWCIDTFVEACAAITGHV